LSENFALIKPSTQWIIL